MKRPRSRRPTPRPKLGALGTYSDGKLDPNDRGDLQLAVGIDPERKLVQISFGTQLSWLAMDADSARQMGQALINAADALPGSVRG